MGTPPLQSATGFLACPFPMMSASYHIIEVFDIYQFRNSSITLCSLYTMQDSTGAACYVGACLIKSDV